MTYVSIIKDKWHFKMMCNNKFKAQSSPSVNLGIFWSSPYSRDHTDEILWQTEATEEANRDESHSRKQQLQSTVIYVLSPLYSEKLWRIKWIICYVKMYIINELVM